MIYKYTDLRPDQLAARLVEKPLAVVPWGALEWHGPHLPLGLDGLVAEAFAARLAERTGGVLLPACYLPVTTLPHAFSLQTRSGVVAAVWDDLLGQLRRVGFRAAAIVSGHYAHPHEVLLTRAAQAALEAGLPTLACPPLAVLGDEKLLDHAARWETSQLLSLRPDLVALGELDRAEKQHAPLMGDLAVFAVLGEDPRQTATPAEGEAILAQALDAWQGWAEKLLAGSGQDELRAFNAGRLAAYDQFVNTFFRGSWEEALAEWWQRRTGGPGDRGG